RGLEWLLECPGEGLGDVCEVEIHVVALCGEIDPIEVADPLRLNQRGNGAPGNAHCAPLDLSPIGVRTRVPDDVEGPSALHARCTYLERRWIDENLSARAAVHVHLLVDLAVRIHLDHDGRKGAGDRRRGQQDVMDQVQGSRVPAFCDGPYV